MEHPNILIIDDERSICDGCCLVLGDRGYSVDSCRIGSEGLNRVRRHPYDVVLLDLKLADMDGMEILTTVRREKPDVYFIVITGYATVQSAIAAMKVGAFDYLEKPFSDDELIFAVERALEKKRLVEENLSLRKELIDRFGFSSIVGENPRILEVFEEIQRVAPTDCTVLICGESGTGKELIARAIHTHSQRAARQFVAIDCSTLSPSLLESELFGHVKGAFTGAHQDKTGIFELAHDGTLFLDDVANLSWETQGKLLRVLEMREFKPVGSSRFKTTNIRVISATNCDLKTMVQNRTFREDLYYRLNVFPVFLPPLRERKDDVPRLAYHFLRHFCRETGKRIDGFSEDALEALMAYDWPGNVRQLKNVIERLVIMARTRLVRAMDLLDDLHLRRTWHRETVPKTREELMAAKHRILKQTFGQLEKAFLIQALEASNGSITGAADRVGMKRSNFSSLLKKYRIPAKPSPEKESQP
jgi:DNA-binding NtrC family response regulator